MSIAGCAHEGEVECRIVLVRPQAPKPRDSFRFSEETEIDQTSQLQRVDRRSAGG